MSFEPIRRIIATSPGTAPQKAALQIAQVFHAFDTVLAARWGAERAAYVRAVSLHEGTLKVQARAPAARQELKLILNELRNDVNRRLGLKAIGQIVVS